MSFSPRHHILPALACGLAWLTAINGASANEQEDGKGALLFKNVCSQCHGTQAEGNNLLKAPPIAGLPDWYVLGQLEHFRHGRRGTPADGPQAMVMAATVKVLTADQCSSLAAYLELLPHPSAELESPLLKGGVVSEGKVLYEERCMECHRYNATGERVFGSPPLNGQPAWYLLDQLTKFRTGRRGAASPQDANGTKMGLASRYIETEQARQDVVAYILSLRSRPNSAKEADSLFGTADEKAVSR